MNKFILTTAQWKAFLIRLIGGCLIIAIPLLQKEPGTPAFDQALLNVVRFAVAFLIFTVVFNLVFDSILRYIKTIRRKAQ